METVSRGVLGLVTPVHALGKGDKEIVLLGASALSGDDSPSLVKVGFGSTQLDVETLHLFLEGGLHGGVSVVLGGREEIVAEMDGAQPQSLGDSRNVVIRCLWAFVNTGSLVRLVKRANIWIVGAFSEHSLHVTGFVSEIVFWNKDLARGGKHGVAPVEGVKMAIQHDTDLLMCLDVFDVQADYL